MIDHHDIQAQSHFVDLPGGRFHYLSWGAEQAELPSLVLIHGITSSARSWVRVGPALVERYRVYAPDMRGHGDSVKPPAGVYSLRQTADDVIAFMDALDLKQPVLLGHSWGGGISLVLASGAATEQPAPLLSKIILEDPAWNFGRGSAEKRAALYTQDIGRPAAELHPELIAQNPEWSEADIEAKIDALSKVSREAVISVFEQGTQMGNMLPLLSRLTAPTLLLRADPNNGSIIPDFAWDDAQKYLPSHSKALQIDEATHNIHRNKFDAFMQVINDFLNA
jgi:pimeloyl-ACP methyl ester carboxylesterase